MAKPKAYITVTHVSKPGPRVMAEACRTHADGRQYASTSKRVRTQCTFEVDDTKSAAVKAVLATWKRRLPKYQIIVKR